MRPTTAVPGAPEGAPYNHATQIHYDSGAMMRVLLSIVLLCTSAAVFTAAQTSTAITIRAGKLIDGRGGVQQNVVVRVDGGKIASVGKSSGTVTYDLSKYTLLPGFIDT